ncbi:MAG: hypothetical protein SO117_08645, partial [Frisingicoccus sp.]|nr:hypothetical protein [Frisingicoccus sp.]
MKKFVNKLMAGMLAFAMTVSAPMSAMAAPENTEAAPVSEGEITISQEAETTLTAAKALSSLNENYGDSEDGQDNAKSAVKNAIFSNYNDSTDLSRYNISSDEMDSMLDEILGEKDITSTVAVTYETDAEGDVTTTEVEMDPMVVMAAEELEENKTVYNLTEEQTQELLGMYAQYLQLYQDNADMFGVQVPYNTTRDTNSSPIGSLLDVASIPEEYIQAGYVGYDVLSGIIQLYYLGTQFAVTEYKDEVIAGRDAALAAMAPATSDMQEYLLLNDWLANNCQFAMDYIMDEMVQPEPAENQLYTYAYNCMYNMIRQQVYDATYDVMVNQYGMPEDMAKSQADSVADAYMVDVQEDGGSGAQQAASTASSIVGMWGSNQVGVFIGKKAVCFGYASVYAYLLQCAHPEIYLKDGADDINVAENWKSYTELNYELDGDGNPVKDDKGDYVWSADAPAMVDYVKIIFDADATMFGETAPFGEAHYWNAVKLDGKWYYVDPCYVDIYVECMNRDRVETDGNLNHLYFMFSDDSCRDMYKDNFKEIRTLYEGIATDATYEDAWVAFIKSQPYKVDDRTYYFYDSTDLLDIMGEYGNGSSSNSNSRAAGDDYSDYEGLFTDSEYKIVYHTDAQGDTSADFETLIDFNNGQVYNPESEMLEDNALISELYAEHEEYVKEYPSIMISCAYYEGKIYFSLSNCILSYDLGTGAVTKLIEYTEVSGERDMSNGLGGLGFTMTSGDPGTNGITVQNPPIADMTIKSDGKMYVSVATNYGFISGKDFGKLTDYSSYGYQFAESNYNPAYNTYYNNDEPNDNDEFMWSANIVGTIEMSHLAGTDHQYSDVPVPASCTEDEYTVSRCSKCGLIEETVTAEESVQTVNDGEAESDPNEGESTDPGESEPTDPEEPDQKDVATLVIEITTGADEDVQSLAKVMLTESKTDETEGDSADFAGEVIEAKAKEILPEGYTLDDYDYQDVSVKYGESEIVNLTATKDEEASLLATLTIDLMNGADLVDTTTMTADEAEAEEGQTSHVFKSADIEAAAKTLKVTEGYKLSDYSFENVEVEYGKSKTITLTEEKDIVYADATLTIAVYDKDAEEGSEPLVDPVTLKANGEEGDTHTFTVNDIKDEAAKIELPENYILDESSLPAEDVEVVYGSSDTVKLTASKEQAIAKLEIKVYDAAKMPEEGDEDAAMPDPVYETSIEKTGNKGESCTFTVDEIKEAVDTEVLEAKGYTLNEDSIEEVGTTFGAEEAVTAELTANEIPRGKGHRYVKFDETYYTKDDSDNWQTGTCYSCIDCGHAFEVDEDSTVEDNLRSNDTVLTDEEVAAYASKQTKVWTWSTDRTEASMYSVPTELMDHKFDSVWENPAWSSREVATVEGDCTTGKFTATLSDGTTETETITAGKHSYLNQEEKDDAGQVTQEAAVQWTWEEDLSKATVTFKCDVCGKTETKEVAQKDMETATTEATCTEAGTAKYTATVTVDEVNYISSRETETDAALGHDYGEPTKWTWTEEEDGSFSAAIATFTCSRDTNHTIDVDATIESVPTDATCTEAGKVTYTATAELDGEPYTDTKTVEGVALGHDYGDPVWNWTEEKDGSYSATATITCSRDENHTVSENAEVTSVTTEPTCTEAGKVIYTATAELNGETCTDTKEVVIEALGHNYGDPVWTWTEDYSGATAAFTCKNDAGHTETKTATVTSESTDATCTKAGTVTYTATVELEGKEYTDTQTVEGQALGHDYGEPEWNWTEQDDGSYSADTATFTCKRDTSHKVSVE